MDDKFEFLGVNFTQDEARLMLEAAGYQNFELEYGRGVGGFQVMKLCCDHPDGKRMFAEYAWKQERDAMVKRLMLQGLTKGAIPA
jgi:hypothetical protein